MSAVSAALYISHQGHQTRCNAPAQRKARMESNQQKIEMLVQRFAKPTISVLAELGACDSAMVDVSQNAIPSWGLGLLSSDGLHDLHLRSFAILRCGSPHE